MWTFPSSKPAKQQNIEDIMMQMKMGKKMVNYQAKTSEKQSAQSMKNAKNQLRQNNQEAAKIHLQNAAFQKNQATNLQKMGLKQEQMTGQMKNMQNHMQIMNSMEKMGNLANQVTPNFEKMAYTMNQFDENMTKMTINQKMMQQMMGQQTLGSDPMADQMLNVLKQQIAMEDKTKLEQAAQIKEKQRKLQQLQSRGNRLQI